MAVALAHGMMGSFVSRRSVLWKLCRKDWHMFDVQSGIQGPLEEIMGSTGGRILIDFISRIIMTRDAVSIMMSTLKGDYV